MWIKSMAQELVSSIAMPRVTFDEPKGRLAHLVAQQQDRLFMAEFGDGDLPIATTPWSLGPDHDPGTVCNVNRVHNSPQS